MSLVEKSKHAVLFMPSMSKEELKDYFNISEENKKLGKELEELSTFWKEAATTPQLHDGELFFEVSGDIKYQLKPVN